MTPRLMMSPTNQEGIQSMVYEWKIRSTIFVEMKVEGLPIQMELDTDTAVSILPFGMYKVKFSHIPLKESKDIHWRKGAILGTVDC